MEMMRMKENKISEAMAELDVFTSRLIEELDNMERKLQYKHKIII
jgi:hypothetical protein